MGRRLLLALVLLPALSVAPASAELTAAHRARLARGDVVLLDTLPPGAQAPGLQGGTAIAFVQASPDAVWQVLLDYRRHAGLYPRVVAADVVDARTADPVVRYRVAVGPFAFRFHVRHHPDAAGGRIAWELAHEHPNDLFRESWGYWEVAPQRGGVLLTYAMAARMTLPAFLTRGAERDGLVETVRAVRDRVERAS
jgi:hypothetical protein